MRSSIFSSLSVLSFRVVVCALVILAAVAAVAQSGRRGAPRTPPSAETKQPEDKTEPSEPQRQDLIIGTDRSEVLAKVPLYLYESVLLSCSRRLDESHAVRVDVVSKDMNRSDAVSSAKSQKAAYVVWLQLRTDGISDYTANDALSALHIDYTIFEPLTAKVKAQGRCYQLQYKGGVIAPRTSGTNNTPLIERRLKDAAREAADRILKALDIALPADGGG
jgi:predicted small lipoprotein YifL